LPASAAWKDLSPLVATADEPFPGSGSIGKVVTDFDWGSTSVGAISTWSQSLLSYTRVMLSSKQPICFWWGPELLMFFNEAYAPMLEHRADTALGQPFALVWPDVWEDVLPLTRSALSGAGVRVEEMPLTMTRLGFEEETFWTFAYTPLWDDDGRVAGLINTPYDATSAAKDRQALATAVSNAETMLEEQRQSNRQRMILQRELAHRMKNRLSVVQAIVSQTMKHSTDLEHAAGQISGRLAALSSAQDILTETSWWSAADIAHVVDSALKRHVDASERVVVRGPHAEISAQQALGISLAIHELATNAIKYGALSVPDGRIDIEWLVGSDRTLRFEWRESGGPAVVAGERKGFGSRLTERIVPAYFGGKAGDHYVPEGVRYLLEGMLQTDE
jgi:two-component sensor histidine kinase